MEVGQTHKLPFATDKTRILVRSVLFVGALLAASVHLDSQLVAKDIARSEREVWTPDASSETYRNPIVYADYSDSDAIRLGNDFYLVASSFDAVPGLPILHSRDLIHWELLGHALSELLPADHYREVQPGKGVWAPSLRYHAGEFYIYYPDPDYGIYMVKAKAITGPWSEPRLVKAAKGWIDPCPLWDDDGNAYMVNALAGSRAGAKSVVMLSRMSNDGMKLLDGGSIIIDGHWDDTTLEGPKLYKHGGYYYVFAPAGGVPQGYEVVFRSRSITGPYDRRVVLHQGSSLINGPHQGAWVTTATGEDWFLHFQDRGVYGRVLDLEPMKWKLDGWPSIGINQDSHGTGESVITFSKPLVRTVAQSYVPAMSDEFNTSSFGLQWQWQANPGATWAFPAQAIGAHRMICVPVPPRTIGPARGSAGAVAEVSSPGVRCHNQGAFHSAQGRRTQGIGRSGTKLFDCICRIRRCSRSSCAGDPFSRTRWSDDH